MNWLKKEVTWGILIKFMICVNVVVLCYCYVIAKIGDYKDKETTDYIEYLEQRVELQEGIIELYRKIK